MADIPVSATQRVLMWRYLADQAAQKYRLDTTTVLGVIGQESVGDSLAIRPEPGFWRRYGAALLSLFRRTPSRHDDRWGKYPEIASTSYGLMQVMYGVAIERGLDLDYPTRLCDPAVGIDAGCRQLRWCLDRTANDIRGALLRYNGGGDPQYPDKVLNWREAIRAQIVRAGGSV